jgi:type I restriction enzyme S subunit
MNVKVLAKQPLVVVISDREASQLPTIDAGAAYTAFLHSQVGKFEQQALGDFVDLISETITPTSSRYRDQTFEYVDLREIDDVFGQILLTRKAKGDQIGSAKHRFRTGDYLFAKIMPSLANKKVAYVFQDVVNGVASTEFLILRLRDGASVNPYYLFRALRSDNFTAQAVANVTGATGRQRISPATLLTLKIVVPPDEVQEQIGQVVEEEFRLRALATASMAQADDISLPVLGATSVRTSQPSRRPHQRSSRQDESE